MRRTALVVMAIGFAATAAATTPAGAGLSCPNQALVQPFLPWVDPAQYVLMPNGSLETSQGWQLGGGAKIVMGNEPWKVNRPSESRSLYLPAGATATSAPLCMTLLHPTLRFFAKNSGSPTALLKVEATTDVLGIRLTTPVGLLTASGWKPTLPLAFLTNLASPVSGPVQFRFTALGAGASFQIDDVYVDPFKHR